MHSVTCACGTVRRYDALAPGQEFDVYRCACERINVVRFVTQERNVCARQILQQTADYLFKLFNNVSRQLTEVQAQFLLALNKRYAARWESIEDAVQRNESEQVRNLCRAYIQDYKKALSKEIPV